MADKLSQITGDTPLKRYFKSDYLGAYSIDDGCEPIMTIASLWQGDITLDQGRKEHHVLLQFEEKSVVGCKEVKPLILNSTNRKTLKKLYGDTANALSGKKIQFYIDPKVRDPQDGGITEGLRIRRLKPVDAGFAKAPECSDCGKDIVPAMGKTAAWLADYTRVNYGVPLCAGCAQRRKLAKDAAKPTESHSEAPGDNGEDDVGSAVDCDADMDADMGEKSGEASCLTGNVLKEENDDTDG
ncbi:MAG: hypothetical protein RR058_08005 [Oscillospiraceae bacterium]